MCDACLVSVQAFSCPALRCLPCIRRVRPWLRSMHLCRGVQELCTDWAEAGECVQNPSFMRYGCRAACALCAVPPAATPRRSGVAWQNPGENPQGVGAAATAGATAGVEARRADGALDSGKGWVTFGGGGVEARALATAPPQVSRASLFTDTFSSVVIGGAPAEWHHPMLHVGRDFVKLPRGSMVLDFPLACRGVPRRTARQQLV